MDPVDVNVAQICLELLSLLIAEIVEAGHESANNVSQCLELLLNLSVGKEC